MNIRHIITEAINNAILMQGYREIESALGNTSIDTTPVGANKTAIAYINELSDFAWLVKDAIDEKNFKPSTGTRTTTNTAKATTNVINQKKVQKPVGAGVVDTLVNGTADVANNMYNQARNVGLNGLDPIVGGVVTSFQNGYNLGRGKWNDKMNKNQQQQNAQQQQQQQKKATRRPRPRKTGTDLTTLMSQQYRKILYDYNYVNQLNSNILSRVPGVRTVLNGLDKIKNALSQP